MCVLVTLHVYIYIYRRRVGYWRASNSNSNSNFNSNSNVSINANTYSNSKGHGRAQDFNERPCVGEVLPFLRAGLALFTSPSFRSVLALSLRVSGGWRL